MNRAEHEISRVHNERFMNQNKLIQETLKVLEAANFTLFVDDYQGIRVYKGKRLFNPASMKFEFKNALITCSMDGT